VEKTLKGLDNGDAFNRELLRTYKRFVEDPDEFKRYVPAKIPDGSPIGSDCFNYFTLSQ
jgi:hypothetical protein